MTSPESTIDLTPEETSIMTAIALRFACHKLEAMMNLPGHPTISCSAEVLADEFLDEAHQFIVGLPFLGKAPVAPGP